MRGQGRRRHPAADYDCIRRNINTGLPQLTQWAADGRDLRQITADDIRTALSARQGSRAGELHHVLRRIFAALKQQQVIFHNPMTGITLTTPVKIPAPLSSDRLQGLLDRLAHPLDRLAVALVAIHGVRPAEVVRIRLDDLDLHVHRLRVPRGLLQHAVYLDPLTLSLLTEWLKERHRSWPTAGNPHLLITGQSAHHPG
ncbi:hypothetical protein ACIQK5_37465 [Streptomyces virginiae]|uniref:hypothetical protein n=1 Tax=Streptomyces virginiae TaxID=1961 RepID=UPI00382FAA60